MSRYAIGDRVEYRIPLPDDVTGPVYEVRMVSIAKDHIAYGLAPKGTKVIVRMARHELLEPAAVTPLPQGARIVVGDPEADDADCEW